jgi:hypothetical protein
MILNKKTILPLMILLVVLTGNGTLNGCKREKKVTGKEYIPRDVLVHVITEIHLIDGITNDMQYYRKYNPGDSIDIYSSIFDKHNVDREMYERTIDEYSKYPQLLDKVYDEVLMELKLLQDKVEAEEQEDRPEVIRERNLSSPR